MTTPTNISIATDPTGDDWIWSVTVGKGDGALFAEGRARGPHQASEIAIQARDRMLLNHREAEAHYRNGFDEEIVVRTFHREVEGVDVEVVWVQWHTGDAFTYIRKIDLVQAIQRQVSPSNTARHVVDVIASF